MKINRQLRLVFALAVSGMCPTGYAITVDEFIAINDANGDGVVSVAETQFGALVDANKDGVVDRAELDTFSKSVRSAMNQHRWVNPLPQEESYPGVQCTSFDSPSMQVPVGYCIYLPPSYARADEASKSYPVVYHLHGGSPGNETQAVRGGLPVSSIPQ